MKSVRMISLKEMQIDDYERATAMVYAWVYAERSSNGEFGLISVLTDHENCEDSGLETDHLKLALPFRPEWLLLRVVAIA